MYKRTDRQRQIFGVESQLSESLRTRLKESWAQIFNQEILSILMSNEDRFSLLYGTTGRPNFSVARMLGLCLLQELNNLSDQQALDAFGFDLRWRYALDVDEQDAYLSRRSLVEFRRRLAANDPEMKSVRIIFEQISKTAIKKLDLSTSDQRVDSTHIVSNICTRGRLALFNKTIDLFLKSLTVFQYSRVPKYIADWHQHESNGWFGLGAGERKAKLKQLAKYLNKLIAIFKRDKQVAADEPYQVLLRLFNEQCEIIAGKSGQKNKPDEQIKIKRKSTGETLQSPYDTDASYGHKGKGYSVHITETCNNPKKKEIITDYEVHGAARSDVAKAPDILDRLEAADLKPETLFADGGYPSVPSAVKVVERNVEFVAPVNRSSLPDEVMGRDQFKFDQQGHVSHCPMGHQPVDHRMLSANNGTGKSLYAIFDGDLCRKCNNLERCPVRAPNHRERGCKPQDTAGDFRLEITDGLCLRDRMFANQQTKNWKDRYKIRSGVEATMSELKRSHGMAKLRVRKLSKVCLAVACKVIACNIKRWAKAYAPTNHAHSRLLRRILVLLRQSTPQLGRIWSIFRAMACRQFACAA